MIPICSLIDSLETEEQKTTARVLYEKYIDKMLAQAKKYFPNPTDAEDIVHDAFVRIIRNIDKFANKPEYEVKALLRTYVYHVAMTLYQKRKENGSLTFHEMLEYDTSFDVEIPESPEAILSMNDVYDFDIGVENILKYLKMLKETDRRILIMKFHGQYTVREIAKELEIPESTVSTRLNRALAKIKKILQEESHEQG